MDQEPNYEQPASRSGGAYLLDFQRIKDADERHTAFMTSFLADEEIKSYMKHLGEVSGQTELLAKDIEFLLEHMYTYLEDVDSEFRNAIEIVAFDCFDYTELSNDYVLKNIDDFIGQEEEILMSLGLQEVVDFGNEFKAIQQDWIIDIETNGNYELSATLFESKLYAYAESKVFIYEISAYIGAEMLGDAISSAKNMKATRDWRTEVGFLADATGTDGLVNDYDAFGNKYGGIIGATICAVTGGAAVAGGLAGGIAGALVGELGLVGGSVWEFKGDFTSMLATTGISLGDKLHGAVHN